MTSVLSSLQREPFFEQALGSQDLLAAAKPPFDQFIQEIRDEDPDQSVKRNFVAAVGESAKDPKALYRFFQLYNYLNAEIASTIASLVGNISRSRHVFIDATIPVRDEADYSFEVANWVKIASIDEYADPALQDVNTHEGVSHRTLAAGLLKAIGNFAGLSEQERNASPIPDWLVKLGDDIQALYAGVENDRARLSQGIGAHIYSEFSADEIEFSNACKLLFVDNKGHGFHAYIQENPLITLRGQTFKPASWLMTHGSYDEEKGIVHGVEFVHLERVLLPRR